MEQSVTHRVFFGIGFFGVLISGLVLYRFKPAASATPALTTAPTAHLGFAFERVRRGLPEHGDWHGHPAVADFNRDGNLDLAAANRSGEGVHVFLGDGSGRFRDHSVGFDRVPVHGGLAVGDVDGDGIPDVIATNGPTSPVAYRYDGRARWAGSGISAGEERERGHDWADVAATDFDGDGALDVLALGTTEGSIRVFRGDGRGGWRRADTTDIAVPTIGSGRKLLASDVDGDGRVDAVFAHDRGVHVKLNRDRWRWQHADDGLPRHAVTSVAAADTNGNGRQELAIAAARSEKAPHRGLAVYALADDGTWHRNTRGLPTDRDFGSVHFADFDCDGRPDLAAIGPTHGIEIFRNEQGGKWRAAGWIPATRAREGRLTSGDFNRDGRTDLIVLRANNGGIICFLNHPIAIP